jgi:hypothetical protein
MYAGFSGAASVKALVCHERITRPTHRNVILADILKAFHAEDGFSRP